MNRLADIILFLVFCSLTFAQNNRDPLHSQFFVPIPASGVPAQWISDTEMLGDARLYDICFVSPQRGWAVGDRGAVWTTFDGGQNWQLQETPIDCTLRSVQFLDESFGVVVGHYWFPGIAQGRGVILFTSNGGRSWIVRHTPDLPPLTHVKIFDTATFLVSGAATERCPSGLLLSRDAGQTWRPASTELSDGFAAADFYDSRTGIGIGFHGIVQQFQNGIAASQTNSFGHRRISAVKVNRTFESTGWAVGDRGLILASPDQGFRWGVVSGALSASIEEVVDLKTIEAHGRNLWAAGNPGTAIYMSNDAGRTWRTSLTGVPAAIRKIVFVNENNGWAVGDLGTILATQNGGQTWSVQRTGGTKLSVLGLFGDAETIPFEAFAVMSGNQGLLGGGFLLFRNEKNSAEQEYRLHESMLRVGNSVSAELAAFPILPREHWTTSDNLVEHIQRTTDGRGMTQLRERLVVAIRQWKPEVLLTSHPHNDSIVDELTHREVMEAVKLAEDPSVYPYHLTELGLSAWNVKKVYQPLKTGISGDVRLNTTEPTAPSGMPLEEMTYISRKLVGAEKCPVIAGFAYTSPNTPDSVNLPSKGDFFSGIPILPGTDGRRTSSGTYSELQNDLRRKALHRRNILGILQNTMQNVQGSGLPVSRTNLASHAAELTRQLEPDSAVQILLEMAQQFHQEGDWFEATDIYQILVRQYAQHPLVRQAFIRMMLYAASGEIDAIEQQQNMIVNDGVRTAILDPVRTDPQRHRALLLGRYLSQNFPDLADDIALQFAVASVLRKLGGERDAARFYQTRANIRFDDVWGIRASTEYWMTVQNKAELPIEQRELLPALTSVPTRTKPVLDGKFDENDQEVWLQSNVYALTPATPRQRMSELLQSGSAVRRVGTVREEQLRTMSQNFGTQVMFLHDKEFWYIGLRCPKLPGMPEQDRVEILIDVDRDYGTYYSVTIDSSGGVTSACLGARNWNPQWTVARHEDERAWYIEAAIPLSELSERPIRPNTTCGIAIRRLVPGMGIECWNAENSFNLEEGFGLMLFPGNDPPVY